jgi:hypothetical protein
VRNEHERDAPLFTVFSCESAGQPNAREPRGPWLRLTPFSGTKLPSTCAWKACA